MYIDVHSGYKLCSSDGLKPSAFEKGHGSAQPGPSGAAAPGAGGRAGGFPGRARGAGRGRARRQPCDLAELAERRMGKNGIFEVLPTQQTSPFFHFLGQKKGRLKPLADVLKMIGRFHSKGCDGLLSMEDSGFIASVGAGKSRDMSLM